MAVILGLVAPGAAMAQKQGTCRVLCTPQMLVEPTVTVENLARRPRVMTAAGEQRVRRETVFEVILAVDVATRLPNVGFTAEAIYPFAKADNAVEVELELNLGLIRSEQTNGWVSSHVDVVDKFSPAERPTGDARYSHKLNFEWDTAFAVFNRLPPGRWLRNIELEGSLDYVATGLPKAGDVIDGETFVTNASPWSFSLVIVIPVTP